MNWTNSHSRVDKSVTVGSCKISLFADDLVLLASSESDLQHALDRFSAACDQVGMKISTKKSDVYHVFLETEASVRSK